MVGHDPSVAVAALRPALFIKPAGPRYGGCGEAAKRRGNNNSKVMRQFVIDASPPSSSLLSLLETNK